MLYLHFYKNPLPYTLDYYSYDIKCGGNYNIVEVWTHHFLGLPSLVPISSIDLKIKLKLVVKNNFNIISNEFNYYLISKRTRWEFPSLSISPQGTRWEFPSGISQGLGSLRGNIPHFLKKFNLISNVV